MTWSGVLCLFCFLCMVYSRPAQDSFNYKAYLEQYGYLEENATVSVDTNRSKRSVTNEDDDVSESLKIFQEMAHIPITGMFDEMTNKKMHESRCGLPDISETKNRGKRYVISNNKWLHNNIKYRIDRYSNDLSRGTINRITSKAFNMWAKVSSLSFTKVPRYALADIVIKFVTGNHGDGYHFDSVGGILAHAFYPRNGNAHFDDRETWSLTGGPYGHYNLLQVMVHEFGHSLGLHHSSVVGSVMDPYYSGYKPNFKLSLDDINGIRALYGKMENLVFTKPPTTKITTTSINDIICENKEFDAITSQNNGIVNGFIGIYYTEMSTKGLFPGYPKLIADDWNGLPNHLDAALRVPASDFLIVNITYFFKGNNFWKYSDKVKIAGPLPTNLYFKHNPSYIDTAFYYPPHNTSYFIKNETVYEFQSINDSRISIPNHITNSDWRNIYPAKITAALYWKKRNSVYYFARSKLYKLYSNNEIKRRYPAYFGYYWLGC